MLKPTQDKAAIKAVANIISPQLFYGQTAKQMKGLFGEYHLNECTNTILMALEKLGYHKDGMTSEVKQEVAK